MSMCEITPYYANGDRHPRLIGVRAEGDEYETAYVPKTELIAVLNERDALEGRIRELETRILRYEQLIDRMRAYIEAPMPYTAGDIAAWDTRVKPRGEDANHALDLIESLRCTLETCRRGEKAGFDAYWIIADCMDKYIEQLEKAIATLGSGTCRELGSIREWRSTNVWEHDLSCGHKVDTLEREPPRFCPECGAKVSA